MSITELLQIRMQHLKRRPESLKYDLACHSVEKRREVGYISSEQENKTKCRGCAVLSAWRPFDSEAFYFNFFFWNQWMQSTHTEQHTWERSREIWAAWSKNEMGHQSTPVIVCTCPIMIDLCKRKQSDAFYLHVKRCSLSHLNSRQHHNYLKCEILFSYS